MQQVVTLTGVEVKTGQGDKGPWTLKIYKDAGGNKYQTFRPEVQQIADGLIGQQVSVTYEVETRSYTDRNGQPRQNNNNVITSVEAANGAAQQTLPTPEAATAAAVAAQGDPRQTVINRSAALARAIEAHAAGIAVVTDPSQLAAVADLFVKYIETGAF